MPNDKGASAARQIALPAILLAGAFAFNHVLLTYAPLPETWRPASSQVTQTLIWLSGAMLFNRLLGLIVWDGIVAKALGRTPPRLIVQLTGVVVFFLAVSGILSNVFGQSVTALWATSGAVGLIIGFALRNLILDTFSGLAIHLERPFNVGDFIRVHTRFGEYTGRVEETNWRTTRLWTTARTIVVIPNSFITTTIVTNLDRPSHEGRFEMDLVLDFSVPTERAVRVLQAALQQSVGDRGPLANPAPKVRCNGITPYGVEYRLRYFLTPSKVTPSKARNTIVANIAKHLSHAGITVTPPRRDVFLARMPWRQRNWNYDKDQVRQLGRLSLFSTLSEDNLGFLAERMAISEMKKGDVVVREKEDGDSMFILAEGLLEVFIDQPDGTRLQVADLAPGTFFGEKSMLTGEKRSATIVCAADSILAEIKKSHMSELMDENPGVAALLSHAVAEREVQNAAALNDLSNGDLSNQVEEQASRFLKKIKSFFG